MNIKAHYVFFLLLFSYELNATRNDLSVSWAPILTESHEYDLIENENQDKRRYWKKVKLGVSFERTRSTTEDVDEMFEDWFSENQGTANDLLEKSTILKYIDMSNLPNAVPDELQGDLLGTPRNGRCVLLNVPVTDLRNNNSVEDNSSAFNDDQEIVISPRVSEDGSVDENQNNVLSNVPKVMPVQVQGFWGRLFSNCC